MSRPESKLVTPLSLLVDAILLAGFFIFMFLWLRPHVPSDNPLWINVWGALTSSCLTGVFWLAIQMFRLVLRAQRASKE